MPGIDVVTTEEGFAALADDWRDLWAQDPAAPVWTSYEWHWNAWKLIPRHRRSRLLIGVVREGGRVTLILPMVVDHRAGLRRGRWLGAQVAFYEEVVAAPRQEAGLEALWSAVVKAGRLDYAVFQNLRAGGDLHRVAGQVPGCSDNRRPIYEIRWSEWTDWDDYWQARSRKLRSDQRRQWQRLAGSGELAFTFTVGVEDGGAVADWIADRKLAWMERGGKHADWFGADVVPFFDSVLAAANRLGRLYVGSLAVSGHTIAMETGFVQQGGLVGAVTTYDPAWHQYSPGRLLEESCIRYSCDRGYSFYDFLTATSAAEALHKSRFADQNAHSSACVMPFTTGGRGYVRWFDSGARAQLRRAYHRWPELRRRLEGRSRS